MAGARQPIELVIANGRKHLTKEEIESRRASEVAPCTDDLTAPSYLTAAEKRRFNKLVEQLAKLKIMGETDTEALARYVTAQGLYEQAVKDLRKLSKDRPVKPDDPDDSKGQQKYYDLLEIYYVMLDSAVKRQDRYFKQAATAAAALGLTISSRCKLVAPVKEEAPKQNKFKKFQKAAGSE